MASIINEAAYEEPASAIPQTKAAIAAADNLAWKALRALGSLKITVTMFAFAILILFVGTLAQDEQTLVDVKKIYFNSWIAMVPHHVFAPITIFGPHSGGEIIIPIPGGATIGLVLLVNLIAAKLTRFSMQARGTKMVVGIALVLSGLAVTTFVILNAHASNGLQGEPSVPYSTLWYGTVASVYLAAAGLIGLFVVQRPKTRLMQVVLLTTVALLIGLAVFFAFYRIPDPGLRIVWQLFKSLIAGIIVLIGLTMLFGKRGGNVLIHLAVGLMMLGQFVFGDRQQEEMIMLQAGETSNLAFAQDEVELAIIEKIGDDKEKQIAVDQDMLTRIAGKGQAMTSELLPFDIRVDKWMKNSKLGRIDDSVKDNPATQGFGTSLYAHETASVGGAMKGNNIASAYISLIDKSNKNVIGTWLVSQDINDAAQLYFKTEPDTLDKVELDGKSYEIGLRFRRTYKPYEITLENVQQINYSGTETPRDYSSYVKIANPKTDVTQEGRIWMNNPMRFDGETFYQSEFISKETQSRMLPPGREGVDTTGLQVVTNAGWMLPYLSCVFAGLGMLVHFGNTFVRFAGRFDRELNEVSNAAPVSTSEAVAKQKKPKPKAADISAPEHPSVLARWGVPLAVLALIAFGTFGRLAPSTPKDGATDWYLAGQIPAQEDGRIMPLDSVARRFVQTLSGSTYTVIRGNPKADDKEAREDRKVTAVELLFALANGNPMAHDASLFRIDAEELRNLLDLDVAESGGHPHWLFGEMRRPLKNRYSLNQIKPRFERFYEESDRVLSLVMPAQSGGKGMDVNQLNFFDRKILDLRNQLNLYLTVRDAFGATPIPLPKSDSNSVDMNKMRAQFEQLAEEMNRLDQANVARIVPPVMDEAEFAAASDKQKTWRPLNSSVFDMQRQSIVDVGFKDAAAKSVYNVFAKQADGSTNEFHKAIKEHLKYMASTPVGHSYGDRVEFEAWYNYFNPFMQAIIYYCIAVVLTLLSFLFFRQSFRRAAFWICAIVFILHTAAIVTRVYISQRPPVINLYSSAVYIGWASVLAGVIIEKLYPIRLGVLVGSAMGVLTLLVAWGLDTSDTMPVLQAVLDTQFWLTTHVQCITLGYAATFFAGFIGIYALIHRIVASRMADSNSRKAVMFAEQKILYKLCYGIVCFGLFFSFIGTVLGGLWADDSWGRFWGWDPKENGALMIVLWNAILLHARWDKLVLERGFYLLAIGGNIMTAWSWFGTNQLGIGLHSYGFTESVLFILTAFVFSQIAIIIMGLILLPPNQSIPKHT